MCIRDRLSGILQARVAHRLLELGYLEVFSQVFPDAVAEERGGSGTVGGEHIAVQHHVVILHDVGSRLIECPVDVLGRVGRNVLVLDQTRCV